MNVVHVRHAGRDNVFDTLNGEAPSHDILSHHDDFVDLEESHKPARRSLVNCEDSSTINTFYFWGGCNDSSTIDTTKPLEGGVYQCDWVIIVCVRARGCKFSSQCALVCHECAVTLAETDVRSEPELVVFTRGNVFSVVSELAFSLALYESSFAMHLEGS